MGLFRKKYKQINQSVPINPIQTQPIVQTQPIQSIPIQSTQSINQRELEQSINNQEFILEMEKWKDKVETYLKNKFFEIDMRLSDLEK